LRLLTVPINDDSFAPQGQLDGQYWPCYQ
jgi:hypothetical protein